MLTYNTILKEIKKVPVSRLEDLYSLIHSFNIEVYKKMDTKSDILSFSGAFKTMTEDDYDDYVQHTQQTRKKLFDRNTNL